jgi:hypothetical protein
MRLASITGDDKAAMIACNALGSVLLDNGGGGYRDEGNDS